MWAECIFGHALCESSTYESWGLKMTRFERERDLPDIIQLEDNCYIDLVVQQSRT